ncbi:Lanthionine synthetase C-like protein [Actinacidiphila alni]|uniref:Lanthionine synthetase C-like protein n=1 Tax=Actinacidiphila alni TaxID=380248 RepID=A0A1I2LCW4_9ACTN|nr:class III lanthionine synthetase LanKC [Actinacidiphila alni]SFF77085.1 Lanthionine synthetase C-like protein [Actinacidiphila alni]
MRDERWVNRFLFSWNDTLFFDPLDVHYEPREDHFLAELDDATRARFHRNGIWWSHRHNEELPEQGWKIHVSSSHRTVRQVATTVIGHLVARSIDFKIALDLNIFEMLNSKAMARGSAGKLITVYPADEDQFRTCLDELAALLEGAEGAYILSDMRFRDSKALYFRYGQFLPTHTVDVMGRHVPHITGPEGPEPDERAIGYTQPPWQPWPFQDWKPADYGADDDAGLLDGRYRVVEALQFSNTGGVYKAEDTWRGDRTVVVKEARPHTNINPRLDQDALDISDREWTFLTRLGDLASFPTPISRFRHWEHSFIAEEYIDGKDIRSVLLERNPLARPIRTTEGSRAFLRIYLSVFRGLTQAVRAAHERHVILGDLSAANLLVDTDSYTVTVIDLESCRLAEADPAQAHLVQPVDLFTPGFSHSRRRSNASQYEDDLYSLATTMAYFIFPIAAMLYLREDVLALYRLFTDRLGWPSAVHDILTGLAEGRVTLDEALDFLTTEDELVAAVVDVPTPVLDEAALGFAETETSVAAFMAAVADPGRETLFPVDPFAHITNPLGLGTGACGVLWAMRDSGVPIRPEWTAWLARGIDGIDVEDYADGFMNGLAGIAWAADTLGLAEQAGTLLATANERAVMSTDHTFYYGLAGIGMTNLRFHLEHGVRAYLDAARTCADRLVALAHHDGDLTFWLNDFSTRGPLTGLGFGQAGVALFLLRMTQATGDRQYAELGGRALRWEMAHAETIEEGVIMFKHAGTMEPYVEVGSAGVLQVLLRYGLMDDAREVARALDTGQSVLPGYAFGLTGVADALLDAAEMTGDATYRQWALGQLDYVRRIFLFEPAERFGLPREEGRRLLAVPGEGLLRCSCDYLTGSAGLLRVLHRLNSGSRSDFLLDRLGDPGRPETARVTR